MGQQTKIDPLGLVGTHLDRYYIKEIVGSGGMGAVYRAKHEFGGYDVAVKVLHSNLAADQDMVEYFFEEARKTASLRHPHIVRIMDVGRENGRAFLVMEWLDGKTLEEELKEKKALPLGRVAHLLEEIAEAIEYAHDRNVIHRDLKPGNIMLVSDAGRETIRVLDFGVAKVLDAASSANTRITGTPFYASPEQGKKGAKIDRRSDIYNLGVMLYELLSGERPFDADSAEETRNLHCETAPPSLRQKNPSLPPAIEEIVFRALAKQPADRHQTVTELARAFRQASSPATGAQIAQLEREEKGELVILCNVGNAEIEINGVKAGRTDSDGRCLLNSIAAGTHTIRITRSRYEPLQATVTIDGWKSRLREFQLMPRRGFLRTATEKMGSWLKPVKETKPVQSEPSMSPQVFCPGCGASLDASLNFCTQCGVSLRAPALASRAPDADRQTASSPPIPKAVESFSESRAPVAAPVANAISPVPETVKSFFEHVPALAPCPTDADRQTTDLSSVPEAVKSLTDNRAPVSAPPGVADTAPVAIPDICATVDAPAGVADTALVAIPDICATVDAPAGVADTALVVIPDSCATVDAPAGVADTAPVAIPDSCATVDAPAGVADTVPVAIPDSCATVDAPVDHAADSAGKKSDSAAESSATGSRQSAYPLAFARLLASAKPLWLQGAALLALIALGIALRIAWPSSPPKTQVVLTPSPTPTPAIAPPPPEGMVLLEGGEFTMGRNDNRKPEEGPAHRVIVRPFFLDRTEVTTAQYKKFLDENPTHPAPRGWRRNRKVPTGKEDLPVTGVTWEDATTFAKWAGKRLPSEEEWEFAARGQAGWLYPWGDRWNAKNANAGRQRRKLAPVSAFAAGATPRGIVDLIGNVWEWTGSNCAPYTESRGNPCFPGKGYTNLKIKRGGAFGSEPDVATSTHRSGHPAGMNDWRGKPDYTRMGFRCAMDAPIP
ncbi:MAG: protein kinase domain-containing protein, partial [Blastocatellia bacterium]